LIEVRNLVKYYGTHMAVDHLNFTIKKGQIYGFLGPNGAGKSTTMNIMTGYLGATQGQVFINGHDILSEPYKAKKDIGYLPEQPPLYMDMTVLEYLKFVAALKLIDKSIKSAQLDQVISLVRLGPVKNRLIKNLSKGYRQRVGIAQALLGDPKIVILDEPTVGLDPRQIIEIRDLIKDLGREHTVILSSHILSEVQAVCQTILIISKGRLVACDTPENLERLFAGSTTVELTAETPADEATRLLSPLAHITGLRSEPLEGGRCRVTLDTDSPDGDEVCREAFFAFSRAGKPILRMSTARASLEDIFIELTSSDAPAAADGEEAQA
jgi:ABC-2 type transport system ATP-binding protein